LRLKATAFPGSSEAEIPALQGNFQLLHYLIGDLVLDGKDVIQRAVIARGPQVGTVGGVN